MLSKRTQESCSKYLCKICLPLQKLLGQSPSGTQSPLDPVECVSAAETRSLSSHAESAGYVSAEQRSCQIENDIKNIFAQVTVRTPKTLNTMTGENKLSCTATKHAGKKVFVTHLFICQAFLIHHFLQLLLPKEINRTHQHIPSYTRALLRMLLTLHTFHC